MLLRSKIGLAPAVLLLAVLALPRPSVAAGEPVEPPRVPEQEAQGFEDVASSVPEEAWEASLEAPMPLDPKIIRGQLDNGLRYWIRENEYPAGRAEIRLLVKVGSVQEDDDQRGLAHFVEHMAFNGTENFPKLELIDALESFGMRFGADINASTSFDETVYFLRIPTDRQEIVDTAFQILEDWAGGVTMEDEEIERERGVVIEEWRLGLGAGSRLRDRQFPTLFQGSRYAERLPIGTLEVLQNFEPEAARRFYRDWYRPELMAVVAVGDFDRDAIEQQIVERFSDLENPPDAPERVYYEAPEHDETLFAIDSDPEATVSTVSVYHKLPLRPQGTHASYRQSIVEGLYNSMLNRRFAELSQQPNPPFLGAQAQQTIFIPTSEVWFLGAAAPDGRLPSALEALFGEVERVRRYGFTETELEREKAQLMRAFERIFAERDVQDSGNFAEEFTRAFLEDESTPGIEYEWELYQRFLPEITLEEVNAAADAWLIDDNRVVLVAAPEKEGLDLPSRRELLTAMDVRNDDWIRPYRDTVTDEPLLRVDPEPGELVEERTIPEIGVTEWKLSNGVTVVVKPTDFRAEQVLMRAYSPGGTSLAPDENLVAAQSATQVISASGFGTFSARALTNALADKVASVNPVMGPHEEGMVGNASPRDFETLLQLVYLTFTEPRADEAVFNLIRQQMRASLANRDVSPEVAWQEAIQQILAQNHPRRRPISIDLLDEMNLEASYDFYTDRFADASDFLFVFVGNVDPEAIRPLVVKYLGALPDIEREESWRDEGVDPPTGVIERDVLRGLEPKSLTAIVFAGEREISSEESRALGALGDVLQTRLRESLREDLSGTYGAQVSASSSRIPDEEYSIAISFGSDPERVDELTLQVFAEIRRLAEEPPTAAEVDSVKEQMRRQHELNLRENGYWLSRLVDAYRDGEDPTEILSFDERLAQITPEAIQAAARSFFDFDNYVKVSLRPEATVSEESR